MLSHLQKSDCFSQQIAENSLVSVGETINVPDNEPEKISCKLNDLTIHESVVPNAEIKFELPSEASNPKETIERSLDVFTSTICTLDINEVSTNIVFNAVADLMKATSKFLVKYIDEYSGENATEVIRVGSKLIIDNIQAFDSSYKRLKYHEKSEFFVQPQVKATGTHCEMKINKTTKVSEPVTVHSELYLIPVTDTLTA